MASKSGIVYLDGPLWNPTHGCSHRCSYCWARGMAKRMRANAATLAKPSPSMASYLDAGPDGFSPMFDAAALAKPLHWRKPKRIGVSFMGDLFDPTITHEQIAAVFGVMAACPQHIFQVLTKQAERMDAWFRRLSLDSQCDSLTVCDPWTSCHAAALLLDDRAHTIHRRSREAPGRPWPLPNVLVGVSVICRADLWRVDHLRRIPAAVRWLSCEPLIGDLGALDLTGIGWVVVGGESGSHARPLDFAWVRSIRDQCAAGMPFFFKQDSGLRPELLPLLDGRRHEALPTEVR